MLSKNYKHWISVVDDKRCVDCEEMHGKTYLADDAPRFNYKLHPFCRCIIEWMQAIPAGKATDKAKDGADWWLKNTGELPDYYITEKEAEQLGWQAKKHNLHIVAPCKMLFKGEYRNKDGHLPSAYSRRWYEADIDYTQGKRGVKRVVFSNDGLIFVTYDHYKTFHEII